LLDYAPTARRVGIAKCVLRLALRPIPGSFRNLSRMDGRTQNKGMEMLVLSRKKNESIVINDDITIVVVEIRGDKVRLGVEAPKDIPVHRREVFDAIQRGEAEKKAANNGASPKAAETSE